MICNKPTHEKNYLPEQTAPKDSSIKNDNQVKDLQLWDRNP